MDTPSGVIINLRKFILFILKAHLDSLANKDYF